MAMDYTILEGEINAVLTVNTALYEKGDMTKENYEALLNCLAMAFGAEYIAERIITLGFCN